jgi:hypothetical protein
MKSEGDTFLSISKSFATSRRPGPVPSQPLAASNATFRAGAPELGLGNCLNITQATRTDPRAEYAIALKTWRMGNGPGPAKSSTAQM